MKIAIVTGASSGLGLEYVRQISAAGTLDEIWIIARREERLLEISKLVSTKLRAIPLDLTIEEDIETLRQMLSENKPKVKMLVNAAGFGKMGDYRQVSDNDINSMIVLNCRASVEVTNAVLPYMPEKSCILQIVSSAAFQPLPGFNVYAATKAFLLSYSRGLKHELISRKIGVTAVCPYWVKDTNFISIARHSGDSNAVRRFPLASHKRMVVKVSLRDAARGYEVSTPGFFPKMQRAASKVLPNFLIIHLWELLRRI